MIQERRDYAAHRLQAIQTLAAQSRLYEPLINGTSPALRADLLQRQLERVQVLAGYATPFVAYLQNTPEHHDGSPTHRQLTQYWQNTISELNAFVTLKNSNSQVAWLENAVAREIPERCALEFPIDFNPYGNDLFSEHRRILESRASRMNAEMCAADLYTSYRPLATRFNRELAGYYPFSDLNGSDLSAPILRNFLQDYAHQRAELRAMLRGPGSTKAQWQEARRFVERLDEVADFFAPATPGSPISLVLPLEINFRYRMDDPSIRTQILQMSFSAGNHRASYPNGATTIKWRPGQEIVLDMQFAERSLWRPVSDPTQADLQTDGNTLSYIETGNWALLRLMEHHVKQEITGEIPLSFTFPIQAENGDKKMARLVLGVTQTTRQIQSLPRFPRSAPTFW